ncbi:MAG: Mur ligase domain-containing protein [Chitinophagales bacterium]
MDIHFIAIGGAVMHNLAICLKNLGHNVTGSDDIIFDPSKSNLEKNGLLPNKIGFYEENISQNLDAVILGMHAKPDNVELKKAQKLNIPIYSFPQFIYEQSKDKKRVVIAGSHGKTTTTAMIMHVLKENNFEFDYLVGSSLAGFELSVKLTKAPLIILEGDEYLSSPIDRTSKFHFYKPDITMVTGIAWNT